MTAITPGFHLHRARPADAPFLTDVAHAAKRHWGYPEHWIAAWRDELTITAAAIREHTVFVARAADGPDAAILGFYVVSTAGASAVLEHLWVRPDVMGRGVGRALLAHGLREARTAGCTVLRIDSDPNAEGFYLRAGARRVGEVPAPMDGRPRVLPRLEIPL